MRDNHAGPAIEMAIVGPVFSLLLAIVVELGVVLLTQSVLDTATLNASRLILTGQVQTGGGASAFTTALCNGTTPLIPCASLQINVQASTAFANFNPVLQTDGQGNMINTQFTPGTPGQAMLVQVGYNRTYLIAWVGSVLGIKNASLLVSTAVFQNEPYE
jgi:Flp pilus assembly protein TadG